MNDDATLTLGGVTVAVWKDVRITRGIVPIRTSSNADAEFAVELLWRSSDYLRAAGVLRGMVVCAYA